MIENNAPPSRWESYWRHNWKTLPATVEVTTGKHVPFIDYFSVWLGPAIKSHIQKGEPQPIRAPYPLTVVLMAACQWLLENGILCVVCNTQATRYKRRPLEPGQTLLLPVCDFCSDLGNESLDELFEPLIRRELLENPFRPVRVIDRELSK